MHSVPEQARALDLPAIRRREPDPARWQSRAIAWKVAFTFLIIGVVWVLVTDLILYSVADDPVVIARIETAKGWTFVGFGMAMLYMITDYAVRRLARSHATIRAVMQSISDGLLLVEPTGKIALANPALGRMLGVSPGELCGMSAQDFAHRFPVMLANGHVLEPEKFASQRALTGETPRPYKAVIHPPAAPDVVALVTGAPVRPIPTGPVALAVSVIHDLTALEHLDRMRDEFISSAAHTLKTPVATINAQAQLLESGRTRSTHWSTTAIRSQCDQIMRITENLLVLARIRSDSLRLHPGRFDLADVVADAAVAMATVTHDQELHVDVRGHAIVFADRSRVALVVRNLIDLGLRRAVPRTDVHLELCVVDRHGRVAITYQPVDPLDMFATEPGNADVGDMGLEEHVTRELISASSGRFGFEALDEDRRVAWFEIPTVDVEAEHPQQGTT
jgi:PAS domain-containing protein